MNNLDDSKGFVTINEGSGGEEMQRLISAFTAGFFKDSAWTGSDDDGAVFALDDKKSLVFTTDSFVVSPIFFKGGNIGDLAFSGTVNDVLMMGAKPIGLSMGLVIEEGFSKENLDKIMKTFAKLSKETQIPIVTGDTKVMEKGKLDGIMINTTGVGLVENDKKFTKKISKGDVVILSGGLGEHAVALLSERFDYDTEIKTCSKPLVKEVFDVKDYVLQSKDPTRGGLSAALNEICERNEVDILISEDDVPIKDEVKLVTEMLGLNVFELACEGRFVLIVDSKDADSVIEKLQKYNPDASIIGSVGEKTEKPKLLLKTEFGKRVLPKPVGRIVPRIC